MIVNQINSVSFAKWVEDILTRLHDNPACQVVTRINSDINSKEIAIVNRETNRIATAAFCNDELDENAEIALIYAEMYNYKLPTFKSKLNHPRSTTILISYFNQCGAHVLVRKTKVALI